MCHFKVHVIAGDANAAAYKYLKSQEYQDLYNSSVAVMLREIQREVNTGHPFEGRLPVDYFCQKSPPQLHTADDLDSCFMAIPSWRKPVEPRIMRKLWSKIATGQPAISRERGVKGQPRAAAQRGYPNPEDAEDPMMAPPDNEIRQSGRVLELQNRDLWLRPTDISLHLSILITIREEPCKNYRSKTSGDWKAKEDKIEEVKKKQTKEGDDEWNDAEWQPSSWSWQQPMTWTSSSSSSWQQWSSDQTRERSEWQSSADWNSPDHTRERDSWQSPFKWQ